MSEAAPTERVVVERRYNGPPRSGNGGYSCGVVAGLIDGPAEVTLRKPPPLDTPLMTRWRDGSVMLLDGETIVAEGAPTELNLEIPAPVHVPEAREASRSYKGFQQHVFPTCFVCGPNRADGDGLRIFPGQVPGRSVVAAPWTPDTSLAGADGYVRPEIAWAALDCPGAWAFPWEEDERAIVLGRMAASLIAPVRPEEPHVAVGWRLGEEERKLYSGSALFSGEGKLKGFARCTWVRIG